MARPTDHARSLCVMPHDRPRRAVGELRLCTGHHHALVDMLSPADDELTLTVAQLYDELGTVLPGLVTAAGSAPVSGSHDDRLPLNPNVADLRVQIRHVLASWAHVHVEKLRATPPDDDEPAVVTPWLARYTDWAAGQDWVDDYLGELSDLRRRAWSAYDLTRIRSAWTLGACYLLTDGQPCAGLVRVVIREQRDDTLETTVTCSADPEHVWAPEQWTRLGRRLTRAV